MTETRAVYDKPRQHYLKCACGHRLGDRYDDALIVMRLHDFVDLHGELKPAEPEVVLAQNEVGE